VEGFSGNVNLGENMSNQGYDKDEARKGDAPMARLLRAKDELFDFTMEDIHKALEDQDVRKRYDDEMMPLFLQYMDVTKDLKANPDDEDLFKKGHGLLEQLRDKAKELGISGNETG
jgi:hypothetical protein